MAAPFNIDAYLHNLPAVRQRNQQEDKCDICLVKFRDVNTYTFTIERPCRLSCGHIFGRACLAKWLRPHPYGAGANNCPTCRHQLVPAWPNPDNPRVQAEIGARIEDNQTMIVSANRLRGVLYDTMPAEILRRASRWMHGLEREISRYLGLVEGGPFTPLPFNLLAYIPPARLEEICRSMENNLIEPRPIARAGSQQSMDWEATFAEHQGLMEDLYTANMNRIGTTVRGRNISHPDWNFHIEVAQLSGYLIRPTTSQPDADQDAWLNESRTMNREVVAPKERELYSDIMNMGVDLPAIARNEPLNPNHLEALLDWLTERNAFRDLAFNEAYRLKHVLPYPEGFLQARSNHEIYDMLRDCGVFWEIYDEGKGRWRIRDRYLFDDAEERLSDSFRHLLLENAFADPAIQRLFPRQDKYQLYRRMIEMRADWDSERRRWVQRSSGIGEPVVVE